jgi:myosin-5
VVSRGEEFIKMLTPAQAANSRDAIAKITYKRTFNWITMEINSKILSEQMSMQGGESKSARTSRVGVLDIFGFEIFAQNSLEQLCINYANEALHQQFSSHVYKGEIMEYQKEKIHFDTNYIDNQDCLDLIGTRIFTILDDQCRIPDATDKRFAAQLYKDLSLGGPGQGTSTFLTQRI